MKNININKLDQSLQGYVIDIREPYEFIGGHLPFALNIPMDLLFSEPKKYLPLQRTYYLYCRSGVRSDHLCRYLVSQGYDVVNVYNGIDHYEGELIN
ncbi:MAG: rhodanese-like domain-containing protein [Bacilli bacterium]